MMNVQPIENILLQGTSFCNIKCSYCYLEEGEKEKNQSFSLENIEIVFKKIFSSPFAGPEIQIAWHAGEPLAMPINYYRQAFYIIDQLKETYKFSTHITHTITTNGTLINQEWCDFFKEQQKHLIVNISCDGPDFIHDKQRLDKSGNKTHAKVVEGMELLRKNKVRFQIFATITPHTLDYPNEFFDFFYQYRHIISNHIQLNPTYYLTEHNKNAFSLGFQEEKRFQLFLKTILELSKTSEEPLVFKNFHRMLSLIHHLPQTMDEVKNIVPRAPIQILNIDSKGNISSFLPLLGMRQAEPTNIYGDQNGFILGNIFYEELQDIIQSPKFLKMCEDFSSSEQACQDNCHYFPVCGGGDAVLKLMQNGTFNSTETPECRIAVQSFVDVLVEDILNSENTQGRSKVTVKCLTA